MSALSVNPPFPIFTETDGQPLDNGYIWVGTANLNPIVNPINVYWDAALTIPAAQPIRTLGGYPANSGTPARLYVNSDYSIQVQNRNGSVVYSAPAATERYGGIINANDVVYDPAGTGAVPTTVQAKLRESVSVLDYTPEIEKAGIIAGTSTYDIGDAVRKAIDALGVNGGVVEFPNGGAAKILAPVYIPPKGYGVTLELNRFTVSGNGVGTNTIFETGMGVVSYGGSTNWGQPNETVLHLGLVIRNGNFIECGTAIKAFNAIWRSEFSGNWGYTNCATLIHEKRCFYSKTLFNHGLLGRAARGATDPVFNFEEAVNVQTIVGNSASGIYGGSNKSGMGFLFSGGMAGLDLANNAAEGCVTGVSVTGEITGAKISGFYLELDTVGIDLGSAGKTVDIGGCFFYSNVITAIKSSGGWISGKLESSNYIDAACLVDLSGISNLMTVELAPQQLPMATAYSSYKNVPTNWTLPAGARIIRPIATYDPIGGIASQRSLLSQETNSAGLTALPYAGDIGTSSGANPPFGFAVISGGTQVLVDTQIVYRTTGIATFCAQFTDNASVVRKIAGTVRFGTTVFRQDSDSITVVASNAGGVLRLTFANFVATPVASINDIRVWVA